MHKTKKLAKLQKNLLFNFFIIMKLLKLTLGILFFGLGTALCSAQTIVDADIVRDATWTPDMNPIIVKKQSDGMTTISVANGAKLNIKPGVEVYFDDGISFKITNQCLRGYNSDKCLLDDNGRYIYPQIIANGTADSPIIFSSLTDAKESTPKPGDWGSFIVDSDKNQLTYVDFLYGGDATREYFIEIGDSKFENNRIEYAGNTAILLDNSTLANSVVANSENGAIACVSNCDIKNNLIANNAGNAITLDVKQASLIKNNMIYNNGGIGLVTDVYGSHPFTLENNYFLNNKGGVLLYSAGNKQKIKNNNFLGNEDYILKTSKSTSQDVKVETTGNWFGIDTGASNSQGKYYVSNDFVVRDYVKDAIDFNLPKGTIASDGYAEYIKMGDDDKLAEMTLTRKIVVGKNIKPGALMQYSLEFKNAAVNQQDDIELAFIIPADQALMACSAKELTQGETYDYVTTCKDDNKCEVKSGKLYWNLGSIGALNKRSFTFVTLALPNIKTTVNAPMVQFSKNGKMQLVRPALDVVTTVNKANQVVIEEIIEEEVFEPAKEEVTPEKKEEPKEKPVVKPVTPKPVTPKPAVTKEEPLATGYVVRDYVNGVFTYLLRVGNKYYALYNKDDVLNLDAFSKSSDRYKEIAVYGDWYYNSAGTKVGIDYSRFEIL